MKQGIVIFVIATLLVLTGCGSSDKMIMKNDLSFNKVGDRKAKVGYGMSRSQVEKVIGKGRTGKFRDEYPSGITIMYREDTVASIFIDENAKDIYETSGGLKIGMLESDAKKKYGDQFFADVETGAILAYAYDTSTKSFLNRESPAKKQKSEEEMEDVLMITMTFDNEGYATSILMMDQKMSKLLR